LYSRANHSSIRLARVAGCQRPDGQGGRSRSPRARFSFEPNRSRGASNIFAFEAKPTRFSESRARKCSRSRVPRVTSDGGACSGDRILKSGWFPRTVPGHHQGMRRKISTARIGGRAKKKKTNNKKCSPARLGEIQATKHRIRIKIDSARKSGAKHENPSTSALTARNSKPNVILTSFHNPLSIAPWAYTVSSAIADQGSPERQGNFES